MLYDAKMQTFNETEWRPEAWLSFLMTGLPAGTNALPTMVPRVDPNNLVLTKAIKELMDDLDPVEDYIEIQHLKMQKQEVSRAILKELHKYSW